MLVQGYGKGKALIVVRSIQGIDDTKVAIKLRDGKIGSTIIKTEKRGGEYLRARGSGTIKRKKMDVRRQEPAACSVMIEWLACVDASHFSGIPGKA